MFPLSSLCVVFACAQCAMQSENVGARAKNALCCARSREHDFECKMSKSVCASMLAMVVVSMSIATHHRLLAEIACICCMHACCTIVQAPPPNAYVEAQTAGTAAAAAAACCGQCQQQSGANWLLVACCGVALSKILCVAGSICNVDRFERQQTGAS